MEWQEVKACLSELRSNNLLLDEDEIAFIQAPLTKCPSQVIFPVPMQTGDHEGSMEYVGVGRV